MTWRRIVLISLLLFTLGLLIVVEIAADLIRSVPQSDTRYDKTATAIEITNRFVESAIANTLAAMTRIPISQTQTASALSNQLTLNAVEKSMNRKSMETTGTPGYLPLTP